MFCTTEKKQLPKFSNGYKLESEILLEFLVKNFFPDDEYVCINLAR